jgi:hypothetical protein
MNDESIEAFLAVVYEACPIPLTPPGKEEKRANFSARMSNRECRIKFQGVNYQAFWNPPDDPRPLSRFESLSIADRCLTPRQVSAMLS